MTKQHLPPVGGQQSVAGNGIRESEPPIRRGANQPPTATSTGPSAGERKIGKRSDPAFRATTFFVRKDTQRKSSRLLEDQDSDKDLSELVEELLAKWVAEQPNA